MTRVSSSSPLFPMLPVLLVLILSWACVGADLDARSDSDAGAAVVREVLDENGSSLGSVALFDTCSPEAGTQLRRGLALLHNMTFSEAEAEFREALRVAFSKR